MSSGPVGLDSREYGYSYYFYTVPDGNSHFLTTHNQWLVTKVQIFAEAATPATFVFGSISNQADIEAGGCLTLEPNGAYRGGMSISGQGAVLVVEFWYQAAANGSPPVSVTP
jgi:hypothetical protein